MNAQVDFDLDGPHIGGIRLVTKTAIGFVPRSAAELERIFAGLATAQVDLPKLHAGLLSVVRCLNENDVALAAMKASRLAIPVLTSEDLYRAVQSEALIKASPDDPERPGYPAGAPDGKGGEFRPKDVPQSVGGSDRAERLKRLAQRKLFRSIARRVLSVRRVLRLIGSNVVGKVVEDVPIVGDVVGSASLADDLDLLQSIAEDVADSDAAIEFVQDGPYDLHQLQRSPDAPQSFGSFDAFRKIDDVEKQFGPAGDGFDYHHIVEQGPNAGRFSQEQLQSTDNIVRIPRLLHEEITSIYRTVESNNGQSTSPRLFLRGKSFEEQREFGLKQLRRIGILR